MEEDIIKLLPQEVIVHILTMESIEINDIISFGMTCKQFNKTIQENDHLWRIKFFQSLPHLKELYESHGKNVKSWRKEVYQSVTIRNELIRELSQMSKKFYTKPDLSFGELKYLERLFRPEFGAHPLAYDFIVDELTTIINSPVSKFNLTDKYYAHKLVKYFKQCYLSDQWEEFMNLPSNLQTMEFSAILISQWGQPEKRITRFQIEAEFDKIVDQIKEIVRIRHPDHPVFLTSQKTFQEWKRMNIDENQWDKTRSLQIISAICEVLFDKMQFNANSNLYYEFGSLFIDQVFKRREAVPIMLAIIFESVARRLGVHCEPVSFPAHFFLRWKEKYAPSEREYENFYIDFFDKGKFLTKNSCPRIDGASRCPIENYNFKTTVKEVTEHIICNIETTIRAEQYKMHRRSILELNYLIKPCDTNVILELHHYYCEYQIDPSYMLEKLNNSVKMHQTRGFRSTNLDDASTNTIFRNSYDAKIKVITPKKRFPELKYAVGMIMRHKSGYDCVIIGWETYFAMPKSGCSIVYDFDDINSPSYYVLIQDGSFCYTPQVNLSISTRQSEIKHGEIGKYFYQYCGSYYLPNRETEFEYPEDGNIRNQLLNS